MTSYTPPCARTLRRIRGTSSSSRTMSGARRRSSTDSNNGTTGSVQLSVPAASANKPACLASRWTPSTSSTSCVMLTTKLPIASRPSWSRTSAISENMPSGGAARAGGGEAGFQRPEVGDEVVRRAVARHLCRGGALLGARERGVEAPQHAGQVLAEHLAGVARGELLPHPALLEPSGERLAELGRDRSDALCSAQLAHQLAESLSIAAQTRHAVFVYRLACHVVGDKRVAVAVGADPRSKLKERRDIEPFAGVGAPQGALELVHELGHNVEQVLRDEVQPPGAFLGDRGLLQAQLAREPQQLDVGAQALDQGGSLAG